MLTKVTVRSIRETLVQTSSGEYLGTIFVVDDGRVENITVGVQTAT